MVKQNEKQNILDSKGSKSIFQRGLKYLAIALPLLFISPIIITIGFKALNKSNNYLILILGGILMVITITLVIQAFRIIMKALFTK